MSEDPLKQEKLSGGVCVYFEIFYGGESSIVELWTMGIAIQCQNPDPSIYSSVLSGQPQQCQRKMAVRRRALTGSASMSYPQWLVQLESEIPGFISFVNFMLASTLLTLHICVSHINIQSLFKSGRLLASTNIRVNNTAHSISERPPS